MKNEIERGKIDVHGVSLPSKDREEVGSHFAIATLAKSMHVHQSNLSIDDDARLHGANQGHLFTIAEAALDSGVSSDVVGECVRFFLNEMPWSGLTQGDPSDVTLALEDAFVSVADELGGAQPLRRLEGGLTVALVFWPDLFLAHAGQGGCHLYRAKHSVRLATREDRGSLTDPKLCHVRLRLGDVLTLISGGIERSLPTSAIGPVLAGAKLDAEGICERLLRGPSEVDRTAVAVRFRPESEEVVGAALELDPGPFERHAKSGLENDAAARRRRRAERRRRRIRSALRSA